MSIWGKAFLAGLVILLVALLLHLVADSGPHLRASTAKPSLVDTLQTIASIVGSLSAIIGGIGSIIKALYNNKTDDADNTPPKPAMEEPGETRTRIDDDDYVEKVVDGEIVRTGWLIDGKVRWNRVRPKHR